VKVVALTNVLMRAELKLENVERRGIRELNAKQLSDARSKGEAWKLLCSARRTVDGDILASVRPERLKLSYPMALVSGTSSAISVETDVLAELISTEQDPGLETTAYGLLADFVRAVRK